MANATDNRNYMGDGAGAQTPPKAYDHKVGANVEIFAGTLVGVLLSDSDLPIVPLTLDGTTEFRGLCVQHINNLGGQKGDMRARVANMTAKLENASAGDALTSAHLLMPVFAIDNQTVANNNGGGARPCVGMLTGFNASDGKPMVWCDATYAKLVNTVDSADRIAVRYATTAALAANTYANGNAGLGATLTANANGALTAIDGQTPALNDKVLVQFESTAANNGVYVVTNLGSSTTAWVLTRDPDHAIAQDLAGSVIVVEQGALYGGQAFILPLSAASITIGTTALSFTRLGLAPAVGPTREVRAVATSNVNLATVGLGTIDGVTVLAGDRVLLTAQTTGTQNGIYLASAGTWAYAPDWAPGLVYPEMLVAVSEGTLYAHSLWRMTTAQAGAGSAITVGTTSLAFALAADASAAVNPRVRCVATSNLNLATTALTAIDGVTPVAGDRVLVVGQTTGTQNGVYIASAGAWSYAPDYVQGQVKAGMVFEVSEGTSWASSNWKLTTAQVSVGGYITIGTTAPVFVPRIQHGTSSALSGTPGTITISNVWLIAGATIHLTVNTSGGTEGFLKAASASRTAMSGAGGNGSFIILSSGNETSTVDWTVVNF